MKLDLKKNKLYIINPIMFDEEAFELFSYIEYLTSMKFDKKQKYEVNIYDKYFDDNYNFDEVD